MQELIKVTEKEGQQLVSAREMHEILGSKERFSKWFNRYLDYGFEENVDYTPYQKVHPSNNQEITDYVLRVDMAKELAMLSKSEKGKELRKYFIELEKAWNDPTQVMARALQIAQKTIENYKDIIEEQRPKVEFYDDVTGSKDTFDIGTVSKILNKKIGRNKLFEFLRDKGILDRRNTPYQRYVDRGYFRLIESTYTKPNGEVKVSYKTVVYQAGVDYINKLLKDVE